MWQPPGEESRRRGVAQQCDGHPTVCVRGAQQGSAVGYVPNGTAVIVCNEIEDAYRVEIPSAGLTGWVKRSNIQLDDEVVAAQAASASAAGMDCWVIPPSFHGILIGRGGEHAKQIRAVGVQVDVGSDQSRPDVVLVRGPPDERRAAKELIDGFLGFSAGTAPLGVLVLRVPGPVRGRIIGTGGTVLRELVAKHGCSIDVPKDGSDQVRLVGPAAALWALKADIDQKFDRGTQADILEQMMPDDSGQQGIPQQVSAPMPRDIAEALTGRIVKWDDARCFGFIQPSAGGQQLFCHCLALVDGSGSVRMGDEVTYVEEHDDRKGVSCAGRIQVLGGFLGESRFALPYRLAHGAVAEALFFGEQQDSMRSMLRLLDYLRSAVQAIDVCVFSLTSDPIARVLVTQHKLGKRVRIIVDDDQCNQQGSDVARLRSLGMNVRMDNSRKHMHHKFSILDGVCLLTGSFNYTQAAAVENEENILVTNSADLVRPYAEQFEKLWRRFAEN